MQPLLFACEDRDLARGKGFAPRRPEGDTPDKAGTDQPGAVGGEGQERVASRAAPPAGATVLDPQYGVW